MHQLEPRTETQYPSVWHTRSAFVESVMALVSYQKWELFFVEPGVIVNEQYCWDILLSQQIFAVIKHVADDNF